ncbi:hypothetical protein P4O66_011898 [Electrophorus voltai]|uniref:Uncharacterized protein n=1 Tax=Electrophorus voltai TaxID=2609070 RepID=A0AAD8Z6V9_9TELE|nr:hypothetical protein P4O66_011898 [Electrophorus voltai]
MPPSVGSASAAAKHCNPDRAMLTKTRYCCNPDRAMFTKTRYCCNPDRAMLTKTRCCCNPDRAMLTKTRYCCNPDRAMLTKTRCCCNPDRAMLTKTRCCCNPDRAMLTETHRCCLWGCLPQTHMDCNEIVKYADECLASHKGVHLLSQLTRASLFCTDASSSRPRGPTEETLTTVVRNRSTRVQGSSRDSPPPWRLSSCEVSAEGFAPPTDGCDGGRTPPAALLRSCTVAGLRRHVWIRCQDLWLVPSKEGEDIPEESSTTLEERS